MVYAHEQDVHVMYIFHRVSTDDGKEWLDLLPPDPNVMARGGGAGYILSDYRCRYFFFIKKEPGIMRLINA